MIKKSLVASEVNQGMQSKLPKINQECFKQRPDDYSLTLVYDPDNEQLKFERRNSI